MIITNKHGRKKSVVTPDEMEERAGEVVSALTDEEQALLFGMIDDDPEEQMVVTETMIEHRYHTQPVTMEQFLEDPYYLGESCSTLYPELRKDLIDLFDYPYREVVLTGAIGVGKTYVLSIALCRILYELSCLVDPQKTFGLSSGTEMVIPLISKNLILAREVMKTAVDDKIRDSIYFMEKFAPKISKENTIFPNNIRVVIGSYGSERILGSNVFAVGLDECLSKFSLITIENGGIFEEVTIGDLLAMGPEDRANCRVVGLDHDERKISSGWWRIKESTVQDLVAIETASGRTCPSRKHPILVQRGDWCVYEYAENLRQGDLVVRRVPNATKGTEIERGGADEDLRSCKGKKWGEKSILRKEALGRDEGEDASFSCWQEEKATLGGDQAQDERIAKGTQALRGDASEDERGCEASCRRSRMAEAPVREDEEKYRRRDYTGVEGHVREEELILRKEAFQRGEGKDSRRCSGSRRLPAHGGVEGEDIEGECACDQGSCEKIQVHGEVTRRDRYSLQDEIREESCGVPVRAGRSRESSRRGQDGLRGVRDWRCQADDSGRLSCGEDGRHNGYCGGERSSGPLSGSRAGEIFGDVGGLCGTGMSDDPRDQQQASSRCLERAVCEPRLRGSCNEGCYSRKEDADCRELEFAGVRQERIRVDDLPGGLVIEGVVSVTPLGPEQTYSLCTEFQTFIADGFVVHNTNFPPTRRSQQITTAIGQRKTIAHFDPVEKVYRSLLRRIKSRFQKAGGDFPGMVILASSAATLESFTERKMKESANDPQVFVRDHTPWTAKPETDFCGEKFWLICSTSSIRARILDEDEYDMVTDEYLEDNDAWLIDVPIEFLSDFETDLENAMRDIAGISTQAISAFIQRIDALDNCADDSIPHAFSMGEWTAGGPGSFKWKTICKEFERKIPGGYIENGYVPLINPKKLRWCHIDTSISGDCVTGDTLVATPYGNKRIDSIETGHPVYSYDSLSGKMVVVRSTDPGLKRKNSRILKVFVDGGIVRCTPDHQFMLRDGTYRCAKDLCAGDSLMPFYRHVGGRNVRYDGYEQIYNPGDDGYTPAHKIVAEYKICRKLKEDECVHHVGFMRDENKIDNRPENLLVMSKMEHYKLHQDLIVEYNKSEKHRRVARKHMEELNANPTPAMTAARMRNGRAKCLLQNMTDNPAQSVRNRSRASERLKQTHSEGKLADNHLVLQREDVRGKCAKAVAKSNRIRNRDPEFRRKVSDGLKAYLARVRSGETKRNHEVLSVEDGGREDTYCLTVDGCHNFVVVLGDERFSSGIVVHNCTGFAVGHVDRWVEVVRRSEDNTRYQDYAPFYHMDIILRINPPPGEQIYLPDIRRLVYELQAHGYSFMGFSTDKYQYVEMHQQVKRRGIHCELISMDEKTDPYDELKRAIYEDRIRYHRYEPFIEEMKFLEYDRIKGKIDHPKAGCFVGETRIPLLDGTCPMISELDGESVWLYSCKENGDIVPGFGRGRKTKHVSSLVDVVLDSGAVERCTPEHLWMLRDGSYKESQNLVPGVDRLMPINRTWPVNGGYEKISGAYRVKVLTHHMVWEFLNCHLRDDECVHHKDNNKVNNDPSNLDAELFSVHAKSHTERRWAEDSEYRKSVLNGAQKFNLSANGRKIHSDALKRTMGRMTRDWFVNRARGASSFRSDIDQRSIESVRDHPNANAAARALGCGRNVIMRVLKDGGFKSWDDFLAVEPGDNHKVRYVIPVELGKSVPVYDLEVDHWDNFALSSGVFVHNSKDISDAVAGVVYGLLQGTARLPIGLGTDSHKKGRHEHAWVSPMIPVSQIDIDDVRDMAEEGADDSDFLPILFGD